MSDAPARTVLETIAVAKDYGDGFGLSATDLHVAGGELVMLVGHNGSGKSTLLGMCAGLVEPTEGEARVVGTPADSTRARTARSYLPDRPVLYDDLSLWEHIAYNAALHSTVDWEDKARGLLELFNLALRANDLPARFSRGMQQKAATIIGLVRPFQLLLVDEPFLGLDTPSQQHLVELLVGAVELGAAVVVSTHQPNLVTVATRCVGLSDGELVYDGEPDPAVIDRIVHG